MAASNENNYGELNDPHGGIGDLQRKILITPLEPEATFKMTVKDTSRGKICLST